MPIYRFELEARLGTQAAIARLKELVGPPRSFWRGLWFGGDDVTPPFIGKIEGDFFRIRRDIRYRNSFQPLVWGRISSVPMGTRISVTMFLHPIVALFVAVWFCGVGVGVWSFFHAPGSTNHWVSIVPVCLLVFGIALVCGGFFPEAIKARRLLEQAFAKPGA